jgi:hypothetical protein
MSNEAKKPIILLAFANDRDDRERYLRNLAEEARRLREALEPACARSSCARTPPCGTSSTSSRTHRSATGWRSSTTAGTPTATSCCPKARPHPAPSRSWYRVTGATSET